MFERTVSSMHRFSLMAPQHPKNDTMNMMPPMTMMKMANCKGPVTKD